MSRETADALRRLLLDVAARQLGRAFVGVELNPDYAAAAARRIETPPAPVSRDERQALLWEG